MQYVYNYLFLALWLLWCVYWFAAAGNVKQTARSESSAERAQHIVPLIIAILLFNVQDLPFHILNIQLLPQSVWTFWTGAMITIAGLLMSVWARLYLGRNWSGIVTLKQDHELITSGPYRLVRHPIYTGLLVGFVGSAFALGQVRGVLAVVLVAAAFWRKLQREETWLTEEFGDSYRAYRGRVAALIPFVI